MKNVAAIDLGTNTIRILVAQKDGAGYKTLFSSQIITRLGEGLHETGFLTKEAMERTANGVSGMVDEASRMCGPFSLKIFGAHACRKAKNIDQLSEIVKKATGAIITVLSWEDEASFALAGVRMVVGNDIKRFILFDIGGGSTEYILSDNNITSGAFGTDLGVIRLSEKFTTHHPVNADEYKALMVEVSNTVSLAFDNIGANGNEAIIGTAGTVTSLAAIAQNMQKYDYKKINNYRLTKEKIGEMKDRLFAMSIEERSEIEVLQDGREDLIVPGIAIIEATLNRAGADSMVVSDFGLREGLVMSLFEKDENDGS